MAILRKHGDWGGPGEEDTAKFLEKNLPEHWIIDANVYLPTKDHEDVDLLVTGDNRVFLVENKHWGPEILVGDKQWVVRKAGGHKMNGHSSRKSPMGPLAQKARKATQIIKDVVPANSPVLGQKVVDRLLVLSHPKLTLHGDMEDLDRLAVMKDSAKRLIELDAVRASDLIDYRSEIIEAISGLPARLGDITKLGEYVVKADLGKLGLAQRFDAEHAFSGESVVLYCYPHVDNALERVHQDRDVEVLQKLAHLQRTWMLYPWFESEEWGWRVRPQVRPEGARSFSELSVTDALKNFGAEPLRDLVEACFEALGQVHAAGVVHRALSPGRVWLGRSQRVLFSDFFHARIDDMKTLIPIPVDKVAKPFASPESREDSHAATEASDVFSLAQILAEWLKSEIPADGHNIAESDSELMQLLETCRDLDVSSRPTAVGVVETLRSWRSGSSGGSVREKSEDTERSESALFEVGQLVADRYQLEELLGEGGAAMSWRAYDTTEEKMVVLRLLKNAGELERLKGNPPFMKVNHKHCQSHLYLRPTPEPGLHIVSFVEGQTLEQRHDSRPLEVSELRTVAFKMFSVLYEAFHKEGLVHGDISSRNVLVDEDLEVFFIDLASVVEIDSPAPPGTPRFKPPELRKSGGKSSAQSDIYSAGAVLIDLMLNRPPYEGAATDPEAGKVLVKPTTDELALWGRDGEALLKVLFKAVLPDVAMRPSHAAELARQIKLQKAPEIAALPEVNSEKRINETVDELRKLFVDSKLGNRGMLALGGDFAEQTYVKTQLDFNLLPALLNGDHELVLITGNPGDGKTTFLNALRTEVLQRNGKTVEDTQAVWSGLLGTTSFTAVMDASESYEGKTSDDVLKAAMLAKDGAEKHVTVVAINDGRLRQFVDDFEEEVDGLREAWEDLEHESSAGSIVVVDLKQRALVSNRQEGLGLKALDAMTSENLWEERGCGDCSAKGVCPILRNVKFLRTDGRMGIHRLTLMSHLSSQRRATLRDFRSAASFAITSDSGCADVHHDLENGDAIENDPSRAAWNLIFDSQSGDKLLREWKRFDPSRSISPVFLRNVIEASAEADLNVLDPEDLVSLARREFLTERLDDESLLISLGHYRHLVPFLRFVMDHSDGEKLKTLLLDGLGKLSGVFLGGFDGLRAAPHRVDPRWTLIKSIDSEQFSLELGLSSPMQVEHLPDSVALRHLSLGVALEISLDMAEVLLRAADGEVFGDYDSLALRQQALAFVERVAQSRGDRATLLSPAGEQFRVETKNGRIEMVGQE